VAAMAVAALVTWAHPAASADAPKNALGANYNEHFEDVDYRDLEKAETKWLRIFMAMPEIDRDGAAGHGAVRATLDAHTRGYRTILTFKWPFARSAIPRLNSDAMKKEIARLDQVLPLVMGKADILEIGNEPFIETRPQDRGQDLNAFYEAMAKRVIAYRKAHCGAACRTVLYMGSLTEFEKPGQITPTTERWMEFVRATPEIAGVDIHPHIRQIGESKIYLDYILPRLRPDQSFIATEFSLVWWWKEQMTKPVSADFARIYQLPPQTQNWQVVSQALAQPFGKAKWDDFLSLNPWFENNRHYLRDQMAMFTATGRLAIATYGFKQGSSMTIHFGPNSAPWLINSVFAPRSISANPDGSSAYNYGWITEFRELARPNSAATVQKTN
jgi:hypothetical protein